MRQSAFGEPPLLKYWKVYQQSGIDGIKSFIEFENAIARIQQMFAEIPPPIAHHFEEKELKNARTIPKK